MASVAVVHTARRVFSATALKLYVLVGSAYAFGVLVWVSQVRENLLQAANNGVLAVGNFVLYAVLHTSLVVQVVLLVAAVALVSLAIDLARTLASRQAAY